MIEAIWPIIIKGCSTGCPPIHVKIIVFATSVQKRSCVMGRNVELRCLEVWRRGANIRMRMEKMRARTPPSLLGMERRIA